MKTKFSGKLGVEPMGQNQSPRLTIQWDTYKKYLKNFYNPKKSKNY